MLNCANQSYFYFAIHDFRMTCHHPKDKTNPSGEHGESKTENEEVIAGTGQTADPQKPWQQKVKANLKSNLLLYLTLFGALLGFIIGFAVRASLGDLTQGVLLWLGT